MPSSMESTYLGYYCPTYAICLVNLYTEQLTNFRAHALLPNKVTLSLKSSNLMKCV